MCDNPMVKRKIRARSKQARESLKSLEFDKGSQSNPANYV
jgi:hypothetical protein